MNRHVSAISCSSFIAKLIRSAATALESRLKRMEEMLERLQDQLKPSPVPRSSHSGGATLPLNSNTGTSHGHHDQLPVPVPVSRGASRHLDESRQTSPIISTAAQKQAPPDHRDSASARTLQQWVHGISTNVPEKRPFSKPPEDDAYVSESEHESDLSPRSLLLLDDASRIHREANQLNHRYAPFEGRPSGTTATERAIAGRPSLPKRARLSKSGRPLSILDPVDLGMCDEATGRQLHTL